MYKLVAMLRKYANSCAVSSPLGPTKFHPTLDRTFSQSSLAMSAYDLEVPPVLCAESHVSEARDHVDRFQALAQGLISRTHESIQSRLLLLRKHSMSTTVLLIDDSKFLRRAKELAFSRAGYGVLVAADGEEGLRVARDKVPDVIVLDMMLPKLSSPELLQELRQDVRTAKIPIIVLSSLPQSNETKLKSQGATAYFEKSKLEVDAGSAGLIRAVESALSQSSKLT